MPDKSCRQMIRRKILRLLRQQRQQMVNVFIHGSGTFLFPRPNLRRHIMHLRNAGFLSAQSLLYPGGKTPAVYRNHHVRLHADNVVDRISDMAQNFGNARDNLCQPHNCQIGNIKQRFQAFFFHQIAADAGKRNVPVRFFL